MAVSRSVGSSWMRRARSLALSYWDQACLLCSGGIFRGAGRPWSASSGGLGGRLGTVRRICRGLCCLGLQCFPLLFVVILLFFLKHQLFLSTFAVFFSIKI